MHSGEVLVKIFGLCKHSEECCDVILTMKAAIWHADALTKQEDLIGICSSHQIKSWLLIGVQS